MEARSGPRFSTDGHEAWKWHERNGSTCVSSTCLDQAELRDGGKVFVVRFAGPKLGRKDR
jgi:hypothetical protein